MMTSHKIGFTEDQLDKIGNTIIYLTSDKPLSKTKILKLLYLVEERSIEKCGVPFFNIDFNLWKLGPVNPDIFIDLSEDLPLLSKYIEKKVKGNCTLISPKKQFDDSEFSDNDMEILNSVKAKSGLSAKELINYTHQPKSPWYKEAKRRGVLEILEGGHTNSTDFIIDFRDVFDGDQEKIDFYQEQKDYFTESNLLKR